MCVVMLSSLISMGQEKKETEKEKTNSNLNVENLFSPKKENVSIISYNELPGPVKNKLYELQVTKEQILSVRVLNLGDQDIFAVSFLQNDKLRTMRFKPDGQVENK